MKSSQTETYSQATPLSVRPQRSGFFWPGFVLLVLMTGLLAVVSVGVLVSQMRLARAQDVTLAIRVSQADVDRAKLIASRSNPIGELLKSMSEAANAARGIINVVRTDGVDAQDATARKSVIAQQLNELEQLQRNYANRAEGLSEAQREQLRKIYDSMLVEFTWFNERADSDVRGWSGLLSNLAFGAVLLLALVLLTLAFLGILLFRKRAYRKRIETVITHTDRHSQAKGEALEPVAAGLRDGLIRFDSLGQVVDVNPSLTAMTGYSRTELVGKAVPPPFWPSTSLASGAHDRDGFVRTFSDLLATPHADREVVLQRADGQKFRAWISTSAIRRGDGSVESYLATVKDLSVLQGFNPGAVEAWSPMRLADHLASRMVHDQANANLAVRGGAESVEFAALSGGDVRSGLNLVKAGMAEQDRLLQQWGAHVPMLDEPRSAASLATCGGQWAGEAERYLAQGSKIRHVHEGADAEITARPRTLGRAVALAVISLDGPVRAAQSVTITTTTREDQGIILIRTHQAGLPAGPESAAYASLLAEARAIVAEHGGTLTTGQSNGDATIVITIPARVRSGQPAPDALATDASVMAGVAPAVVEVAPRLTPPPMPVSTSSFAESVNGQVEHVLPAVDREAAVASTTMMPIPPSYTTSESQLTLPSYVAAPAPVIEAPAPSPAPVPVAPRAEVAASSPPPSASSRVSGLADLDALLAQLSRPAERSGFGAMPTPPTSPPSPTGPTSPTPPAMASVPTGAAASGQVKGHVLLLEDDATVAAVITQTLRNAGMTVETFASAEEALPQFRQRASEFDVIVADLALPGLDGASALRRMRRQRPELRALLLTSDAAMTLPTDLDVESTQILTKPFSAGSLREAIAGIMRV
ncbi:MAG: response regulator [Phycisphaerales bacterium]|nr:response regulator [Phycisphaerales bacterium]